MAGLIRAVKAPVSVYPPVAGASQPVSIEGSPAWQSRPGQKDDLKFLCGQSKTERFSLSTRPRRGVRAKSFRLHPGLVAGTHYSPSLIAWLKEQPIDA